MPTLTSSASTIVVQASVSTDASFGSGNDAGSMQGDLWTPGRDAQGRVNLASWDTVPRSRWVSVAGTRLDALDAAVKAAVPSWAGKDLQWHGILQSWSGFALDLTGSRAWIFGGGHSDGYNNGLYRFDMFRMAWAIQDMPSDRSNWSTAYTSNYNATNCPESQNAATAKNAAGTLNAVNDVYYDELPDSKPTARHTYSTMVYVPQTNEVVMVCRRLWRFSLSSGKWSYRRLIRDQFAPYMDNENGIGTYDEVTGEVLTSATGSQTLYRSTGYKLFSNLWSTYDAPWNRFAGADVRHGRILTVINSPEQTVGNYASPGRYWRYNLDTRSVDTSGEMQFEAGLSRADFAPVAWYYDGYSTTYIPSRNRYWLLTKTAAGAMAFFEIDPTTTPWTIRRMSFTGAVPQAAALPKRRLIYWPALNAVTLTDVAGKDISLYRL